MPSSFGRYTVSNFLPPANPLVVETGTNWEYIRIINNSPYLLGLNFEGVGSIDFPEMFLEDILIYPQYRGKIVVTPVANLLNTGQAISNLLSVTAYAHGELSGPQSQPLTQQAVSTTASGNPLFTSTFRVGAGSVGPNESLNVFNPLTSGKVYTFHSARVWTNDINNPICRLFLIPGADFNLPTPVAANSHDGSATPRVSTAHVTGHDGTDGAFGTFTELDGYNVFSNTLVDFLIFPDITTLSSENNLILQFAGTTAGKTYNLTMKWEEGSTR